MVTVKSRQMGSVPEISEMLQVSKYFLRKHINEGDLPYYKVGKGFKLYVDDVEKLIDSLKYQK